MKLVKRDKRGKVYEDDFIRTIMNNPGSIRGDHIHLKNEDLYLITGKIDLIIENQKLTLSAPTKIMIPKNTPHIIKSITKSIIIEKLK